MEPINITTPATIAVDLKKSGVEEALLEKTLKERPQGPVIVIFKSSKTLYLCRDGKVLKNISLKRSELDAAYKMFKGTVDDRLEFDFPIPVALGPNAVGHKEKLHDLKTPEGEYSVCQKNGQGRSQYTVALVINYPNAVDASKALATGEIAQAQYQRIVDKLNNNECPPTDTPLGGGMEIHGLSNQDLEKLKRTSEQAYRQYLRFDHPERSKTTARNWTFGCVGLEMVAAFYLYKATPKNTPVIIYK
jgi:murein L,D-transpeptidase YafK